MSVCAYVRTMGWDSFHMTERHSFHAVMLRGVHFKRPSLPIWVSSFSMGPETGGGFRFGICFPEAGKLREREFVRVIC